MIRALFGLAFPVVGLGLVAAFAGPDLVTGTQGAPMVVAGVEHASLKRMRFDGGACPSTLLFDDGERQARLQAGVRVVAYQLRPDGQETVLAIRKLPGAAGTAGETVTLLFDDSGHLAAVDRQPTEPELASATGDCLKSAKPNRQDPI